ncbi:PspC domain-containing protein [Deltaproteobacteria bacterium TL4]
MFTTNLFTALILPLGGGALIFGLWTVIGLLQRSRISTPKKKKKWVLGVCADYSQYVGIPLWVVRLYALLYSPLLIGVFFYFLYYFVMKERKTPAMEEPNKRPVKITKMDSHYY